MEKRRIIVDYKNITSEQLSLINGDATLRPVGEAIQGYLRTVGITVEFETFTLPNLILSLFI